MSHTAETKGIRPTAILKRGKSARRYTLEEYLRREARAEGSSMNSTMALSQKPLRPLVHNIAVANTSAALVTAFIAQAEPYLVFGSQQLVYLPALNFSLYPDILVVAEAPLYWD